MSHSFKRSAVSGQRSAGSALVETALMLPIGCFLLVAILYFGSAGLLRQELLLLTRFAAETDGTVAYLSDPGATVPRTGGTSFPDGEFARWNGNLVSNRADGPYLTDAEARAEMIKISWDADQLTSFDPSGGNLNQSTGVTKTFAGYLFYDCGAKDRAPEVADQESRWMHRRTVAASASHDAELYGRSWGDARYGIAGLPPPVLAASASGIARAPGTGGRAFFTRDLPHAYAGTHPAVEEIVVGYWQGAWPVSGYPAYKDSGAWWLPD